MLLAGLFVLELLNPLQAPTPLVLPPLPDEQVLSLWGQTCLINPDTREPISFLCQHDMRDI